MERIPEATFQQYERFIARSVVSNYLNPYFRLEAIIILIAGGGEKPMKKKYGDKWLKMKRKIMKAYKLACDMKFYYDALLSKDIDRNNLSQPLARRARDAYNRLPLMMPEVELTHIRLLRTTGLGNRSIRHDCFQKERLISASTSSSFAALKSKQQR